MSSKLKAIHMMKKLAELNSSKKTLFISLNALLEEGETETMEKFIGVEGDARRTVTNSDLSSALQKAFYKMSSRQKDLCRLLGEEGLTVSEASRRMSVPRSTLQEEIKRIREVFRKDGLENYLK